MSKSTEELQNELKRAEGLENFLVDNQKDFRQIIFVFNEKIRYNT